MATRHRLSLDILDIASPHILKLVDTSAYGDLELLPVECSRLEIWLPGMTEPRVIEGTDQLPPAFIRNITGADLGLAMTDFPDGLYRVRFSISPNNHVFVEYNYLRVTRITNEYLSELCAIRLEACEPTSEQHERLHDLRYIDQYIQAAKAKVEICDAPTDGVQMLIYAEKLLGKYRNGNCLTCR
jgi:hypothetical protein